ncbi:MAG: nucleotide sugar dehydrogenase [Planctomycetes bacterium]|nr:nucleotide sugar dehydrogenase [Planctomycetota bacterium]
MSEITIIGGCGHVGLPLGLALARAGHRVVALDIDATKVAETNAGRMPFADKGADELLPKVLATGSFCCTTDKACLEKAEIVITVIGTPLDEHLNPRFEVYDELIAADRTFLRTGQLLVLRSTVYPGTTERIAAALASERIEVDVAFCPERVAEGVALEEISTLPQIVSGTSARARKRAAELFRTLTPDVIEMEPRAAELTKLFNNTWRYIQFATANQFFMIANEHGLDFYEIHRAMTENYPRAKAFPKAGFAAGPCLFKDTMQIASFYENAFFLGHSAMLVNEGLPNYLVRRALLRWPLRELTVGILGMAFKGDSDDPRESLAYKLKKILERECRAVVCSDPFVSDERFVAFEDAVERCDLLFIGTPHTAYRTADFKGKTVIDIWNVTQVGISVV